jgi:hypothetical protein
VQRSPGRANLSAWYGTDTVTGTTPRATGFVGVSGLGARGAGTFTIRDSSRESSGPGWVCYHPPGSLMQLREVYCP